jgi:predicted dehydrogenase
MNMAIIGLGKFGGKIIHPIQHFYRDGEIKVTAVCDRNVDEVKTFVNEWGGKGYNDYKQCIDDPTVEFVYVATPPATHKEIASYALSAGKHVLCEKPLSHDLQSAEELVEAAGQAKVVNAMHFGQDYSPVFTTFHRLVQDGYLGKLKSVELKMLYPTWPPTWQQNEWIMTREQGGFLLEQGIHLIHFVRKVFGNLEVFTSDVTYGDSGHGCETNVQASLEVGDGVPFSVLGEWPIEGEEMVSLTAVGSEGTLVIENWRILKGGKDGSEITEIEAGMPETWILDEVLKAIKGEEARITSFADGYEALRVIEGIRK